MLIILKCSKIFVQFCIEQLNSMQAYKQRWNYVIFIQQQRKNLGTMQNPHQKKTITKSEKKKFLFEPLQVFRLFKNSTVTLFGTRFRWTQLKQQSDKFPLETQSKRFNLKQVWAKDLRVRNCDVDNFLCYFPHTKNTHTNPWRNVKKILEIKSYTPLGKWLPINSQRHAKPSLFELYLVSFLSTKIKFAPYLF